MAEWIVEIGDGNPHIKKMIPLIRCKDCKYFDPHGSGFKIEGSGACTRVDNHVLTMKTGFCWVGEKVKE